MDDNAILSRITELVDEEHRLRGLMQQTPEPDDAERSRLQELERSLDQCWDLLRRRRAARDAGQDPQTAGTRPAAEVERYLQ